jgi:DmsE family decaheme c-type cytochrome
MVGSLLAAVGLTAVGVATQTQQPAAAQAAAFVGPDTCTTCHQDMAEQFKRSAHGHLAEFERAGQPADCESCHGPGSRHAETGDPGDIRSFADAVGRDASQACLTCHQKDRAMHFAASQHAMSDVGCANCHAIHQSREVQPGLMRSEGKPALHASAPADRGSLKKREPELCFQCHNEKRAKMWSPSHHPVREGQMSCSSCHDVHGTGQDNAMLKTDERVNELCQTCHASKMGPFVFEHAPVEENCLTCHDPHGTVANKLLKQGEPFLCLQCHEMHFHNARVAPSVPYYLPSGGSTNPNGASGFQRAFGTRCTVCHTKIHGTDLPSQGITGRGSALLR